MIPFNQGTLSNSARQRKKWLSGAGARRKGELLQSGSGVSVWEDETILEMDSGDGCLAIATNAFNAIELHKNGYNEKFYTIYILLQQKITHMLTKNEERSPVLVKTK